MENKYILEKAEIQLQQALMSKESEDPTARSFFVIGYWEVLRDNDLNYLRDEYIKILKRRIAELRK